MSSVSDVCSRGCYTYSFRVPTQNKSKQLFIEQNATTSLQVTVEDISGEAFPVPRYWMENLPTRGLVPKEFFDSCKKDVCELGSGHMKVYFLLGLVGGGQNASIPVDEESKAIALAARKISENGPAGLGGAWTLSHKDRMKYTQEIIEYLNKHSSRSSGKYATYRKAAIDALKIQAGYSNVSNDIKRITNHAIEEAEE